MFQKELTLIKQVLQKNVCFVIILKMLDLNLNHMFVINYDVLMTPYELKNIAILNVKGVDFRCILWGISRNEAVNKLNKIQTFALVLLWYKKSWKEFYQLKNIDQKFYCSDYYDVSINKYGVKYKTSLRFWENKGWINEIGPHGWFQWYFRYWLGGK